MRVQGKGRKRKSRTVTVVLEKRVSSVYTLSLKGINRDRIRGSNSRTSVVERYKQDRVPCHRRELGRCVRSAARDGPPDKQTSSAHDNTAVKRDKTEKLTSQEGPEVRVAPS
jgi:hypothetical protein